MSGRAALALQVHVQVLPRYWFEGTPEGVQEMLLHVSPYLGDTQLSKTDVMAPKGDHPSFLSP